MLDRWQIEVVSAHEVSETGRMQDFSAGLADDEAANRAMTQAERAGWFVRDREDFFSYDYLWDTPREMEEWIADEWHDFIGMDDELKQATRSAWALGEADAQVRVRVKILITCWKVKKEG
jgi:hypothetical protein